MKTFRNAQQAKNNNHNNKKSSPFAEWRPTVNGNSLSALFFLSAVISNLCFID
jgi:hypothetical protein